MSGRGKGTIISTYASCPVFCPPPSSSRGNQREHCGIRPFLGIGKSGGRGNRKPLSTAGPSVLQHSSAAAGISTSTNGFANRHRCSWVVSSRPLELYRRGCRCGVSTAIVSGVYTSAALVGSATHKEDKGGRRDVALGLRELQAARPGEGRITTPTCPPPHKGRNLEGVIAACRRRCCWLSACKVC